MTVYDLLSSTSCRFDFIEICGLKPGCPLYDYRVFDTFHSADEAIDAYGNIFVEDWRPVPRRDSFDGTTDEGLDIFIAG